MFKKIFGSKASTTMSNAEVEKAMDIVDGQKLGESEEMLLFGGFQELNEYHFFEGLFVSTKNFKSKNGASIAFKGSKGDFTLPSAIQEFECDYAKPLQRHVAQISFDISKAQIKKIQKGDYKTVEFSVKKQQFLLERKN
ncbi:hypothetical protein [Patiriisocius sp. Uisw_017]|jgi:hypothetical protein|uniref:hypothetical protein n=1 Tax=Patiriisocius sp. Uisw_017 TaxID=3230968 RepID=UPI0039E8317E